MPGPTQEEKGDEIVRKINARVSPLAIDFSVDACKNVPTNQIAPTNAMSFSESLITEVFRETGIPNDEATQGCLNLMAERIMPRKLLQITMLQHHTKWSSVVQKLDIMKVVRGATGMPMCMSAPDLALIIVAVLFRKIQPERLKSLTNKSDFVEFFGHLNGMQWLPIAIRVNELVGDRVFAIELDQNVTIPKVRREKINGRRVAIVTTKKPQTNIYEAAMQAVTGRMIKGDIDISKSPDPETNNQPRQSTEMDESYSTGQPRESIETDEPDSSLPDQSEAIEMCDGSQIASDESGSASKEPIGKFETNDIPLRSIAPSSIKERSPDLESQQGGDPETEPNLQLNSDTIRDHARQMKVLGKRLPSPDQKFVRRVRRDMRRFANLADERENEMAHNHPSVPSRPSSTSEHSQASSIDLFGRYKMLWKGALRESGSIPESLRELVRHDCDPNQLFYLEETEADFLAANAMRNENGQ